MFYDPQKVDPSALDNTFPAGDYRFMLSAAETKASKKSGDAYLQTTWLGVDGLAKGKKVFGIWMLQGAGAPRGLASLQQFNRAAGIDRTYANEQEWLLAARNKIVTASVVVKDQPNGDKKNEIKRFAPAQAVAQSDTSIPF